jgi:hypothetical protein
MLLSKTVSFISRAFGPYTLSRDEKNIAVKCPHCGKVNSDKKKLVIRTVDTACHCWVCGYKARSLVFLLKKFRPDMLEQYVREVQNKNVSAIKFDTSKYSQEKNKLQLPSDFKLLVLSNKKDPDVRKMLDYALRVRNLSQEDLWRYNVGMSEETRWKYRLIFPSFDKDGNLNYYVARAVTKTKKPKYDAPNVEKLPVIFDEFNLHWDRPIILCEGPLDMIKCGVNAVPLLGSEINESSYLFEKIISMNSRVVLALDSDMKNKTMKYVKKLESYDVHVSVADLGNHSDPGSMTKEQMKEVLEQAVSFSWKDRMLQLLSLRCTKNL